MTTPVHSLPDLLTVKESAEYLRIGTRLTYEAVKRGDLPSIRIGGAIRIPRDALLAMIAEATQEPAA